MNDLTQQSQAKVIEILLVEDSPGDVLLMKTQLEQQKVCNHVGVAKDGVEALQYLRQEGRFANERRPDLILLDLNMPRMDGREFLEEIKRDGQLRSIPVIVLTCSDADDDIYRSYDLQASGYITKPVEFSKLVDVVSAFRGYWIGIIKLPEE